MRYANMQQANSMPTCQHANMPTHAAIQESMALRLTDALGANTSLTRLSLASVGLLAAPATALGDALRRNAKVGADLSLSTTTTSLITYECMKCV